MQTPRSVQEKDRKEGVEIPLQPMVQTMLRQDVSLEIPRRTNSHLHPLKDPTLVQVQVHA